MQSADLYLKRSVLGLSVALVVLLGVVALYSLLGDEEATPVTDRVSDEPESPQRAYPGELLAIDDLESPLTIGCLEAVTGDDVFVISITNRGLMTVDYLVQARLTADDGPPVEALADVAGLLPGEVREVVLLPEDPIPGATDCEITVIQSERRTLLADG